MTVSRLQVVSRGLRNRCPNCGGATLFRKGAWFQLNKSCPSCGLQFENFQPDLILEDQVKKKLG